MKTQFTALKSSVTIGLWLSPLYYFEESILKINCKRVGDIKVNHFEINYFQSYFEALNRDWFSCFMIIMFAGTKNIAD